MNQSPAFLDGGGELGARMRALDWSRTPLGSPDGWPQSLKTIVRIMLDSRYAMWMLWGPELTFFCNDAYLPTVGVKRDWVLGARSDKVWEEIWPDIGPRIEHVLRTGQATWDEGLLLFLERSGYVEETYHTFSYSPVSDDHGVIAGMLCVVTEVTERIISERRLAFLSRLGIALAGANSEADVLAALEQTIATDARDLPFTATYVFDDRDQLSARRMSETGLAGGHAAAPDALADDRIWPVQAMRSGAAAMTVSALSERFPDLPHGPWNFAPHQARVVPIAHQRQRQPSGFLVAGLNPHRALDEPYAGFLDLIAAQIASGLAAARARAEERRRAEALEELDRAKTAFFSNVSHEFRTPLTLMMGPLEDALQDGAVRLDERTREALGVAHRNSLRLLRLVNSLLDFSRIEAGRARANLEPVDLASFTAELASSFRSAVEKAGLRLIVCVTPEEIVHVDREMWEKVVLNLISNAFKYTLTGEIRVSLERVDDTTRLIVADTGCGIPAEALPHLFERFYRVPNSQGRTHEGTGIGLALVQEIVNLHGGSIDVHSEVGAGTRMTITLPRRAVTPASPKTRDGDFTVTTARAFVAEAARWLPDPVIEASIETPVVTDGEFASSREMLASSAVEGLVVLADDNADMRDYVRRLLEPRFTVMSARDGEEALDLIRKHKPDLLLTDVMMPHLDGFGLLRAVREDPKIASLPVILLSARAGEESRVEGLEHGADDYLIKPFSARELMARVSAHVGLARLRRESAEAVRKVELRFSVALESSAVGFCTFDAVRNEDGRIVDFAWSYLNPAAARTLDRPAEDLIGRRVGETLPAVWETPRLFDTFVRAVETGESQDMEVHSTAPHLTGWFHSIAAKLGDGLVVWFAEVTRAKQVEAQLRASREELHRVTDVASVMLAHCDRENRYLFVNRAYAARFGLTPAQVVGRHFADIVGKLAFAAFEQYAERALAGERVEFELDFPDARIGVRCMHCVYAPDVDAETGHTLGFVAAMTDVSERRTLEQQLREGDRRKDEFLATLAHELRNPLAPIRQAAAIAKASNATEAQISWSHAVIERQVTHMALLLDDLLDISRITRGKLDLRRERIDLHGVVDAAVETARPLIEGRGHTLSVDVSAESVQLNADRVRLAQVLANLLTNAAKYTNRGGHIRLRANVEAGEVVVRVTDNGIGIASEALLHIFEMFSQVNSALERAEGGLGIGLALVKGLVELHGGRVEARSEGLGHGSEFVVHLPLAPTVDVSLSTSPHEIAMHPPRPLRVLIADDNRDAATSLAMLLQMDAHDVRLAFDGEEAIAVAKYFHPRVLLLDIGMPRRNGYDVARALRAQRSLEPMTLIALTGWGKSEDKDRALSSGFDYHLTKPIKLDDVYALLGRLPSGEWKTAIL
jgi:PAS domain S-box-containing protein